MGNVRSCTVLEATFSVGAVVFLAAHASIFGALQTRATTETSHAVVGDVVVAAVSIVVVVVAAAFVEGIVVVDSVGLGDRRGCDECKELLEREQWLAL
jgi:hypothetical protein